MKKSSLEINGTSFHGDVFSATVNDLIKMCGEPDQVSNDGHDKVNFEWCMETSDGEVFTIYDWKNYRQLGLDELIDWHVGGHNSFVTNQAINEIASAMDTI